MLKNRFNFAASRKLYTPLFTFCPQSETVFDLPSNTIDKAWMSILEIIYPVQWIRQRSTPMMSFFYDINLHSRAVETLGGAYSRPVLTLLGNFNP